MNKTTLSRRKFVQMTVVGAGSLLLFPMCARKPAGSVWRFFTGEEANLVTAIAEQFIPADGCGKLNFCPIFWLNGFPDTCSQPG